MNKFKLSLPLRVSDLREFICRMQHEMSLLKSAYRSAGVTTAQGQMLLEIDRSGPLNVVNLTSLLGLDKSTVSQTLAQLQKQTWVDLREDTEDRRYKIVNLTTTGNERVSLIQQRFDEQLESVLAGLKEQERNAIGFGIGMFASALESRRLQKKLDLTESPAITKARNHPLYADEKKSEV